MALGLGSFATGYILLDGRYNAQSVNNEQDVQKIPKNGSFFQEIRSVVAALIGKKNLTPIRDEEFQYMRNLFYNFNFGSSVFAITTGILLGSQSLRSIVLVGFFSFHCSYSHEVNISFREIL